LDYKDMNIFLECKNIPTKNRKAESKSKCNITTNI